MGIILFRVDERLIHGQVTVGWGAELGLGRYIVVDDELPARFSERELYALGVPEGAVAEFHTVGEARGRLDVWEGEATRAVLLTRDLDHMLRLAAAGALEGRTVNLGGLPPRAGALARAALPLPGHGRPGPPERPRDGGGGGERTGSPRKPPDRGRKDPRWLTR